MALKVQCIKVFNHLIGENIVTPRLVFQQTLEFDELCEYLADGSTVTAADVSAVMKQIEMKLPLILGLNAKVICSPEGLTFRPKVSGSITQSQLKKKLEARQAEDPKANINVNRELETSDLTVNDLTASIDIDIPKKWIERFKVNANFKRVKKGDEAASSDTAIDGGDDEPTNEQQTGGGDEGGISKD
ncbi:MAG: hypothetical protein IJ580_06290 [Prevotella sp.]|nr:hypothetical protein [Prevotella sp.]